MRVLIVEDEALPAMLLQEYLEDAGYEVVGWATNADEALKLFAESQPDLAFVDLHLADGMTGVKIAQEIGRSQRSATPRASVATCSLPASTGDSLATPPSLPVVFVTANNRMLPADYAGAIGCIGKPYSMHGIQSALEYLEQGLRNPPPRCVRPSSLELAPHYETHWS
jgi:CheY-like chemotaxis protein